MTVAVVGGGIAGLAAAWALREHDDVVVLEADDRLGGKIKTTPFAGVPVDEAADAFLARVPHAVELCRELGLGLDDLTSPGTGRAFLWTQGGLHPIPEGLVLGVPADLEPLRRSGLLTPEGLERAAQEPSLPGLPIESDVSIGDLVRRRFGAEVHERLVDPLLGGINAGRTEDLSVDVGAAQLAAVARRETSLMDGLRQQRAAAAAAPTGPVFYAPRGGMERLVDTLAGALQQAGVEVRCGAAVQSIEPGYRVHLDDGTLDVDGIVLATPAFVTAPLLERVAPEAAAVLAAVDYSSVVLVTLAYPDDVTLDGSGFLVPRIEGRLLTACSWFTTKWPETAAQGRVILRASAGRFGDERALDMDDEELVAAVHEELAEAVGLRHQPLEIRISRWPRAFPQFAPGHLDRIAGAEAALPKGIALAGAALRGVGIPTCIGTARSAAARLTAA